MARTKKKNTTPAQEALWMRWQEACRQPVRLPPPKVIEARIQESRKRVRSQFPKESPGWEVEGIGPRYRLPFWPHRDKCWCHRVTSRRRLRFHKMYYCAPVEQMMFLQSVVEKLKIKHKKYN